MKVHLEALGLREASFKFRSVTDWVRFDQICEDYVWEMAVLFATPGFSLGDFQSLFGGRMQRRTVRVVTDMALDCSVEAAENAKSISGRDAYQMLCLASKAAPVNAWSRAWIVDQGDDHAVARKLGVTISVVRGWKSRSRFKPLVSLGSG